MNVMTVIEQVGMLSFIMLISFVSVKTGYLDAKHKDSISKIIVNIVLPCLIISSVSSETFEMEKVSELLLILGMSVFCIASMFLIGVLTAKIMKIPNPTKTVHSFLMSLGNVIFVGYPIMIAMYGKEAFFYAIIYWLLNDLFVWTVGVFMLNKQSGGEKISVIKKIMNPNTISFIIALFMFFAGIKLPPVVDTAMSGVGGLATCLSMIFIGMTLATVKLKGVIKKWWVFTVPPIKLIIMPIIFILIFRALKINEVILGIIVIETAVPVQTVLSIIANEYKSDYEYATVGMFVTTILSMFTLPFICYLLEIMV